MTVKVINRSANGLPAYQTPLAAGMDIRADLRTPLVLKPLQRAAIPTGLYVELPEGFEMQVRPRSGLAAKHGLTVLNAPGTIDADYRGEVKVILANLSDQPFTVEPGERIAQIVVAEYRQVAWQQVEELSETQRGAGGFGSTGR
ncbi:MAG: dUTP diphosphatase [Rikenellaceae bacterium]|nr:dUTP diphosphatase [Rikenellaceae bacterium]